ncbi:hypothetical protein FRC17_002004 [Serendipita sp. 399]|nr:hypothetical protein FRC17_002004 [Serendipita sp. 399]
MRAMDFLVPQGDHQLMVDISASEENPVIFNMILIVDSIDSSQLWDQNPYTDILFTPHGVITDDTNESLIYSSFGWRSDRNWFSHEDTTSITTEPGAWMELAFSGRGIWIFGKIPVEGVVFRVEAVKKYGSESSRNVTIYDLTRTELDEPIYYVPLLADTNLAYAGVYVYNITLISGMLAVDFVGVDGKLVSSNYGDPHSTERVESPQPTQAADDPKRVMIPVICVLTVALLLCVASLFLFRRYRARKVLHPGFGIDKLKETDEDMDRPSHAILVQSSHNGANGTTKRSQSRFQSAAFRYPGPSSSSHPTTPSHGTSTLASSMSTGSSHSRFPDTESQNLSRLQPAEYTTEDGEPLSLSHADLAKVFRRAEELRSRSRRENGAAAVTLEELEPHLEALAQQLANGREESAR